MLLSSEWHIRICKVARSGLHTPYCTELWELWPCLIGPVATHHGSMPSRPQCGKVASAAALASLCTHSGALHSSAVPPQPMAKMHNQVALSVALLDGGM